MATLESQLVKATGVKPMKDRQKFLDAVLDKINSWEDDEYEKLLSDEAKEWAEAAVKASNAEEDIPDFDEDAEEEQADEEEAEADTDESSEDEEESTMAPPKKTKTAKKTTAKKTTTKKEADKPAKVAKKQGAQKVAVAKASTKKAKGNGAAAKPTKTAKTAKPTKTAAGGKLPGIKSAIKYIMIKKPGIKLDELTAALKDKGHNASEHTIVAIRSDFRHSIKILSAEGLTKLAIPASATP